MKTLQDALAELYDASTLTSCDDYFMGGKVKKAERARVLFLIVNHKNIIGTGLHMSSPNFKPVLACTNGKAQRPCWRQFFTAKAHCSF